MLGAGAAGLMCAVEAAKRGRRVVILERAEQVGKKILISGGGRCNFTNLHSKPENFFSANPHFCKSALARYTPQQFIALVKKNGIAFHEKTLGQLFCDGSAREIVRMLLTECAEAGVSIHVDCEIQRVQRDGEFSLLTSFGEFRAQSVVVATGGLSIPKMGATPLGLRLAEQFGLRIVHCFPALVPLTFSAADKKDWCDLSGLSTEVTAAAGPHHFREKMLITHRGLSGPAILQISSYWKPGAEIRLDLLPGLDFAQELRQRKRANSRAYLRAITDEFLPRRFADRWFQLHPDPGPAGSAADRALEDAASALRNWRLTPAGTESYDKAEVTGGGVDTAELSSRTLECRKVPGLFFIGEVVDVTGHLGGFNFQWAWASGYAAGQFC